MFTASLIAADALNEASVSALAEGLGAAEAELLDRRWLEPGTACDLHFAGDPSAVRTALEGAIPGIDVIVQKTSERRRRLIVADMDSTMITIECIDELADYAGIKPQIAAVTERAMRGELDFEDALKSRVALLKGLPEAVVEQCLAERVKIMPGARALVRTIRAHGGLAVLVSGGFTRFAEPVGVEIGFDRVVANRLGISDGHLDGTVEGPIVGAATKRETLLSALAERGWSEGDALAVGDGANDIPMIEAAGLGVAYHAKPRTRAAASAGITNGDLTTILYAMGYPRAEWVA
ncbi:MAG: phosphoserine phosphatase SerB [Sphingomonadales bacterium]|nr:phosphoserine phosphatase SerB [Sphingomonadales bacterium]